MRNIMAVKRTQSIQRSGRGRCERGVRRWHFPVIFQWLCLAAISNRLLPLCLFYVRTHPLWQQLKKPVWFCSTRQTLNCQVATKQRPFFFLYMSCSDNSPSYQLVIAYNPSFEINSVFSPPVPVFQEEIYPALKSPGFFFLFFPPLNLFQRLCQVTMIPALCGVNTRSCFKDVSFMSQSM